MKQLTGGRGNESGHECRGGRSHAHDGHPCGESTRGCGAGWEIGAGENEGRHGAHCLYQCRRGHYHGHHHDHPHVHHRVRLRVRSRSARKQRGEYGPTVGQSASLHLREALPGGLPQSSADRRGRCVCCASHGTHPLSRDGPRTQQMRSWWLCQRLVFDRYPV